MNNNGRASFSPSQRMGDRIMTDSVVQQKVFGQLRAVYESMPKGGIPDRIWRLLLALEQVELAAKREQKR